MKRILSTALVLSMLAAQAQIVTVESIERLNVGNDDAQIAQAIAISPRGDYLLLSSDTKQGLVKWDLATSQGTVLATGSINGSEVNISDDGSRVTFEEVSFHNGRRQSAVKAIRPATGELETVTSVGRHQSPVISRDENASGKPSLTHHHLKLYITRDGVTRQLAPAGEEENYIWASLSPDGSRVLCYVSGRGAFVCDIDGTNVVSMGDITAPKWWDDNTIVGMDEVDDEYCVIASAIVMRTIGGTEQTLTGDDVIATYPLPCRDSGKIAFSTPDGGIYMIHVK